jgi:TfoX/Sxy family transcriptional regulator of competence genes
MVYSDALAHRVRQLLALKNMLVEEKKMMGGLTFMVNGKMCVGILKDDLMARIAPEEYQNALEKSGCREMDFTGKAMKGFVFINPRGTDQNEDLEYWVNLALDYNERAKSSKKGKKK